MAPGPLKRAIMRTCRIRWPSEIIKGSFVPGDIIAADRAGDALRFTAKRAGWARKRPPTINEP